MALIVILLYVCKLAFLASPVCLKIRLFMGISDEIEDATIAIDG